MNHRRWPRPVISVLWLFLLPMALPAQGTRADYERATGLREKWQGLALNLPEQPAWIGASHRFWYRRTVSGGFEFILADAGKASKAPAFDHVRLAAGLGGALDKGIDPKKLPFTSILFVDGEKAVQFEAEGFRWKYELADGKLAKLGPVEPRGQGGGLGQGGPPAEAASAESKPSPDGKWEAFIRDYNIFIRPKSKDKEKDRKTELPLSFDGGEGEYYTYRSLAWAPDSKKLAAVKIKPGFHRYITYIESSPMEQRQPKATEIEYAKPGDILDLDQPALFLIEERRAVKIDNALFPNPYDLTPPVWRKDSRSFSFEYNQRGHQVYRILEADGTAGAVRAVLSEEPKTFFCYSGKKFRRDLDDGRRVIWMSERSGWNHLYLVDGTTGSVINPITQGEWVVRSVDKVDEQSGQVYFQASGMEPGVDPYFIHAFRVNLDGTGLTRLTEGEANHAVVYSSDAAYMIDTRSRVDLPPVMEARRVLSREVVMTAEATDISELIKAGWKAPEVFVAKARDGKTDIWGVIYRPILFNPKKRYPIIENIYAGPQGSFTPKTFSAYSGMQALAELGFIVVQMDGLGTSNRSKEFHDYCWRDLGDAGFPDRILWHKAAAAKYPSYDITRVGLYGTSAGGQSALGGLLFHPDFYKAGFAACGCHDNRMDKIWWNEQWMGWPLGPHYAASSNVDNAYRLRGKLLLVVGEMDQNVDPASTFQVVSALIKADKAFDLLVIPGAGHTSGGTYGERKRNDFFVRALMGLEPPNWNNN